MKHIKTYEEIAQLRREGKINESVSKVNDVYKVKATIDVPQSLVNKIAKKVKDDTGRDAKEVWSDVEIAEAIVTYVYNTFLNDESIPSAAVTGADETTPAQPAGVQTQPAQAGQPQPVQPAQAVDGEPTIHMDDQDLPPVQVQQ